MKKIIAIISIIIAIGATVGTVIAYKNGSAFRYVESPYSAQYDKKNIGAVASVSIKTAVSSNAPVCQEREDGFYWFYPVYHYGSDPLDRGFIILAVKDSAVFFDAWDKLFSTKREELLTYEDKSEISTVDIEGSFVKASDFFDDQQIEMANSLYKNCMSNELYSFGSNELISYDEYKVYTPGDLYLLVDTDGHLRKPNANVDRTLVYILICIAIVSSIVFVVDFIILIRDDRRYRR